jgi:hypothetical protein
MTRIVTTHYRYKPPLGKRKAVAITGPAIVRKRGRADVAVPPPDETEPATPPAADDDAPAKPAPAAAKPAIAISISRKRTKLLRTEQAAEPEPDDPEADAAMHPSSRSCVGRSLDQPTFGRIEAGVAALLQEHGIAPRQFAPSDDPGHHEGQDKQHGDDDERPAAHSGPLPHFARSTSHARRRRRGRQPRLVVERTSRRRCWHRAPWSLRCLPGASARA